MYHCVWVKMSSSCYKSRQVYSCSSPTLLTGIRKADPTVVNSWVQWLKLVVFLGWWLWYCSFLVVKHCLTTDWHTVYKFVCIFIQKQHLIKLLMCTLTLFYHTLHFILSDINCWSVWKAEQSIPCFCETGETVDIFLGSFKTTFPTIQFLTDNRKTTKQSVCLSAILETLWASWHF